MDMVEGQANWARVYRRHEVSYETDGGFGGQARDWVVR